MARAFREACSAAGVTYRLPKHLRRSYASWGLSARDPMWIARQMGHMDTTMIFRIYAQWIPDTGWTLGPGWHLSRMRATFAARSCNSITSAT
jgi:hypothetical protein